MLVKILPSSLNGIGAEVPVPVESIHRVRNLLAQHSLAGLVAQHIRGEEHFDAEDTLSGFGR